MKIEKNIFKRFYKHTFIFVILLVLGSYLIGLSVAQQKNRYLEMQTELLGTKYKTNYKYFKIMSKDIYSMYQDNHIVVDIIAQASDADTVKKDELRKELYLKLKKRYKRLRNMGVMQLHFHMSDNSSFLRMHKPERFGDDLSKSRESIVLTNKTKTAHEGFEVGKIAHGFRFVYPLFNGKKHIGSMEVSFSSDKLISSVLDNFMVDSHFLVSKEEIDKNLWPELKNALYESSSESSDFLLESSTHENLENDNIEKNILNKQLTKTISKKMQKGVAFSVSNSYNYESIVGTFIPIKNVQNAKTVAYLVTFIESDYIDNLMLEERYIKMLFISIVFLLFIFSIYVTINRDRLQEMAHFDELTSLPNRAYFYIELEQEINRAKRLKNKLAIMFIDLDGFKAVNDTHGHHTGDLLLIEVAQRLKDSVRDVDLTARLGGDEFTVVLTDIRSKEDALFVAEKIINKLSEDFEINENIVNIGASIGISVFPEDGKDSDILIKHADAAMYKAKSSGKNCAIMHQEN